MNMATIAWMERHCEKAACLTAGMILCWSGWTYLIRNPNRVLFQNRELTAAELTPVLHAEAQHLEERLQSCATEPVAQPAYYERFVLRQERGILGDLEIDTPALAGDVLPQAQPFGLNIANDGIVPTPVRTIQPPAPLDVRIFTGRCVMDGTPATAPATQFAEGGREVGWVRVIGRFDATAWKDELLAAGYPEYAARVLIAGVEIERSERLPDDEYSAWEMVGRRALCDEYPRAVFDANGTRWENREALMAAFRAVQAGQETLMRPAFGAVRLGDEPPTAQASVDTVWYDDATAQPGRMYRYRMRVICWNRLVGRIRETCDPEDARSPVLLGAWSAASEPIVTAPRTHYFVLGRNIAGDGASVEVWKWRLGTWLRKTFTVRIGDEIGEIGRVRLATPGEDGRPTYVEVDFRTGAVLLDAHETSVSTHAVSAESNGVPSSPSVSFTAVFTRDGVVEERDAAADRVCAARKRLLEP